MLLILSINEDHSTANVIDWLLYENISFDRINYEDLFGAEIEIDNCCTKIILKNKKEYDLGKYNYYWYRRGDFSIPSKNIKNIQNSECINVINQFNLDERHSVQSFIHNYLKENTIFINSFGDIYLNKVILLEKAKKNGLEIPPTLISNQKKDVLRFFKKYKSVISKPIYNGFNFTIHDTNFYFHTLLIDEKDIEGLPDKFYPTKFQACINKAFELRVFYLNNNFYASAIFSQNDEQTKVDFRNYNESKPNRVLPFNLPISLKAKLKKLMNEIEMNSGSIDIIVNTNGDYIFLEVNPIGQFAQVSFPCNYYLENEIAKKFKNE